MHSNAPSGFSAHGAFVCDSKSDIMDTLPSLQGFIFCEGGAGLLASLQEEIDILLVMLNASFNSNAKLTMRLQREFQFLHSMQSDNDILLWLAPKRS